MFKNVRQVQTTTLPERVGSYYIGRDIASKLIGRFFLQKTVNKPDTWQLAPFVQPVSNVDDLLAKPVYDYDDFDIHFATTVYTTCFTVPEGKRWRLIYLDKGSSLAATTVRIDITGARQSKVPIAGGSAAALNLPALNFLLPPGTRIMLQNTNNAGDTGVRLMIGYQEEDVY